MKRRTGILFFSILVTFVGLSSAEKTSDKSMRALEVDKSTSRLEVRHSQIGFRSTLLFYTFAEQKTVLKLHIGNKDKTFPMSATFYFFAETVTEKGIKKWLNNQHSDGLFADVPEPTHVHQAPANTCKVTSSKSTGRSQEPFGQFKNFVVTFKVNDHTDKKHFKLKGFTGATKVHVKTK